MPWTECKVCNKEFRYSPSQQKGECCSAKCRGHLRNIKVIESGTASKEAAIRYLKNNVEYKCSECGITEWNGKSIVLQIEHNDGNPKNNIIDNVRWLCPNCHTQTSTWGFRNASLDAKERSRRGAIKGAMVRTLLRNK
jgi:hypothetical protein